MYFISAAVILLASLALIVQVPLPVSTLNLIISPCVKRFKIILQFFLFVEAAAAIFFYSGLWQCMFLASFQFFRVR